jgi:hypothetical protein
LARYEEQQWSLLLCGLMSLLVAAPQLPLLSFTRPAQNQSYSCSFPIQWAMALSSAWLALEAMPLALRMPPASVAGKWLELLEEMAPGISQVAVMYGTGTAPGDGLYYLRSVEAAARSKQVKVIAIQVKNAGEIEQDISGLGRQPHGAG